MTSRWAQGLQTLLADAGAGRAPARGWALLRSGRVGDVRVTAGRVEGRVQGPKATPLPVAVTVPVLDDAAWARVAAALAGQVRHRARLLAGQVPDALDAELAAAGVSLLPDHVEPSCPCDAPVAACEHVAALGAALTEAVAGDPFVLLRLRGRGRERLLAEVSSAARRGLDAQGQADIDAALRSRAEIDVAAVQPQDWTRARAPLDDLDLPPPPLPPADAGALRLRGNPPGWPAGIPAAGLLGPLVARAAAWARAQYDRPRPDGG